MHRAYSGRWELLSLICGHIWEQRPDYQLLVLRQPFLVGNRQANQRRLINGLPRVLPRPDPHFRSQNSAASQSNAGPSSAGPLNGAGFLQDLYRASFSDSTTSRSRLLAGPGPPGDGSAGRFSALARDVSPFQRQHSVVRRSRHVSPSAPLIVLDDADQPDAVAHRGSHRKFQRYVSTGSGRGPPCAVDLGQVVVSRHDDVIDAVRILRSCRTLTTIVDLGRGSLPPWRRYLVTNANETPNMDLCLRDVLRPGTMLHRGSEAFLPH